MVYLCRMTPENVVKKTKASRIIQKGRTSGLLNTSCGDQVQVLTWHAGCPSETGYDIKLGHQRMVQTKDALVYRGSAEPTSSRYAPYHKH